MTRILASLVAAALLLSVTSIASAGGFAVTTLDAVPTQIVAGESYRIGMMVRQHGITPVRDATPAVMITQGAVRLVFAARADGPIGHYVADVTFPSEGEWSWSVDQSPFPAPQALGTVTVSPAVLAAAPARPPAELAFVALILVSAVGATFGIIAAARRRVQPVRSAP
jgi:hypothetical protein